MQLDLSATSTLLNQFISHTYITIYYYKVRNNFWGNSSNSKKIFTLQKKIISIMVGCLWLLWLLSSCHFDRLTDPLNVCMYVCM
jgi:hypothetical protein